MRFQAAQRLRKSAEFRTVRNKGECLNCGPFVVYFSFRSAGAGGPVTGPRLGVVASRRVGNAVARNRVKRWFREIFRRRRAMLPPECDLVVIARRNVLRCDFNDLDDRFQKACRKIQSASHHGLGN